MKRMIQVQLRKNQKIDWPGVYFMAVTEPDPFADMTIQTAKSVYFRQLCANECQPRVFESVDVSPDGDITVTLNEDVITDENMWRALDLVADALDQLGGQPGVICFGEVLTFQPTIDFFN